MGTTRTFSTMLNEYAPNSLLKADYVKKDWLVQNVEHDDSWLGGNLIVPFKGAQASSVKFGGLTATGSVTEDACVRGSITSQPEAWYSMVFNHRDLMEHGKLSEQNLLKILPDMLDDGINYFKQATGLVFLNGGSFAKVTDATNSSSGIMIVDRVERFEIGQKVNLADDDTAYSAGVTGDYYVTAINMNTSAVTLSATSGGGAANLSSYSVAQNAKFYFDGAGANGFTSLKSSLLSAANNGSSTLYGQTKTAYPYLQAQNVDGSTIDATNILDAIFDAFTRTRIRGKGAPNKVLCSYKHLGSIMKSLESQKGAFHADPKSTKVSSYGWTEITIYGVKGQLDVVALQEMDDDWIAIVDLKAIKLYSNGLFRKRQSPDGIEYFESRATTGYSYIVDVCLFGDLVLERPSMCGVIYGISY